MNIAISFCGEGLGHASRVCAIAKELKKLHKLIFWCPEKSMDFFRSIYPDPEIYSVPLLSLIKKDNRLMVSLTVRENLKGLFFSNELIDSLAKRLKEREVDLIISDYEPFLVKAAKKSGIPVILLNHPGIIVREKAFNINWFFAWVTANFMMPGYKKLPHIFSSFYNGDVGPIIREEIKNAKAEKKEFLLVYLKDINNYNIIPVLNSMKDIEFRIFPGNSHEFSQSLANCRGVISSSGHQLISESLHLKKPMLLIPEIGQYEQFLNARMLEKTGWGLIANRNNLEKSIREFWKNIDKFPLKSDNSQNFILEDDLESAIHKINKYIMKVHPIRESINKKENIKIAN